MEPLTGITATLCTTGSMMGQAAGITHDVYFGTDYNDVEDATIAVPLGVYQGSQSSGQ